MLRMHSLVNFKETSVYKFCGYKVLAKMLVLTYIAVYTCLITLPVLLKLKRSC